MASELLYKGLSESRSGIIENLSFLQKARRSYRIQIKMGSLSIVLLAVIALGAQIGAGMVSEILPSVLFVTSCQSWASFAFSAAQRLGNAQLSGSERRSGTRSLQWVIESRRLQWNIAGNFFAAPRMNNEAVEQELMTLLMQILLQLREMLHSHRHHKSYFPDFVRPPVNPNPINSNDDRGSYGFFSD